MYVNTWQLRQLQTITQTSGLSARVISAPVAAGTCGSRATEQYLGQAIEDRDYCICFQAHRNRGIQGVWRHDILMNGFRPADWLGHSNEEVISLLVHRRVGFQENSAIRTNPQWSAWEQRKLHGLAV